MDFSWLSQIDFPKIFEHLVSSKEGVVSLSIIVIGIVSILISRGINSNIFKTISLSLTFFGILMALYIIMQKPRLYPGPKPIVPTPILELEPKIVPEYLTFRVKTRDNDHAERAGTDGNVKFVFYNEDGIGSVIIYGAGAALEQGSINEAVLKMPSDKPITKMSVELLDNGTEKIGWLGQYVFVYSDKNKYCWTWKDRKEDYLAPSVSQGMKTGLISPNGSTNGCV